ncbi:MAG: glucosaminidase domain-containing protein [Bacteroidales bacterium]|nr:glucosaminidase domain-containing protein [Bacteroidales bacterium]
MKRKILFLICILLCELYTQAQIPTRLEFLSVCDSLGIQHKNVVWAQARLESGNFKSGTYRTKKNCLGIYDSRKKQYAWFKDWKDCLVAYKDRVQKKRGNVVESDEQYISWLISMGYAADTAYGTKIKQIMSSDKKKKRNR